MTNHHLITGVAGFLGSNLARTVLAAGDHVIGVDSLVTGGIDRMGEMLAHPHFKFIRGDAATVLPALKADRIHRVWALAALASPVQYFKRPLETAWAGADAHRATLDFAADHAARIFYASTSELYANPDVVPTPESYVGRINPMSPRAPYDASKLYGETLCAIYHRSIGVDVRIGRLFNSFGPGMPVSDGRVVVAYINAALHGDELPVHGDGCQTRSFCYVDDTIAGMIALMEAPLASLNGIPRPVVMNIGNPNEITMSDLAHICWRSVRSDSPRIAHLPENPDDPRRRCPDITRARELLRWDPRVDLRDGIQRTADWLRAQP